MLHTKRRVLCSARAQLIAIRDYMLSKGWCRNRLARLKGQKFAPHTEDLMAASEAAVEAICLAGGFIRVLQKSAIDKSAGMRVLDDAILLREGEPRCATSWNDTYAKNKRDVIKLLNEAIELTEKKRG